MSLFSSSSPSVDRSVGQVLEGGSGSNSKALFTSPSVDRLGWIGFNISKPKPILFAFYKSLLIESKYTTERRLKHGST
jgi:hypothetical protein